MGMGMSMSVDVGLRVMLMLVLVLMVERWRVLRLLWTVHYHRGLSSELSLRGQSSYQGAIGCLSLIEAELLLLLLRRRRVYARGASTRSPVRHRIAVTSGQ